MIKLRTKNLILILMLIIMAFCFCACGQINSMIVYNDDNSVDEIVTITLKQEEVVSAGYNYEEVKQDIRARAILEINGIINRLNDKISLDIITASSDKLSTLNSYYDGITAINTDWQGEELKVGIKFKTVEVYKYFYNIPETTSSEPEIEQYFFYNKIVYGGNTLYLRHNQLYKNLKTAFETVYPNLANSQGEVLYTYVADLRREHSDADYITKVDDKYYHTWKLDPNDTTKEIIIYYNVANKSNCILVAIGVSFVVLVVLGCVGIIKLKKNKSN